jgi:hypothetical protein
MSVEIVENGNAVVYIADMVVCWMDLVIIKSGQLRVLAGHKLVLYTRMPY